MRYLAILVLLTIPLSGFTASPKKVRAIYTSLQPDSISQFLAFYELYPESPEGKQALNHAWMLLAKDTPSFGEYTALNVPVNAIQAIIDLVNKPAGQDTALTSDSDLLVIEKLADKLPNRQLKGYYAQSEEDVLALPASEIDLSRGMLLSQFRDKENAIQQIRSYEAALDLMALQIIAKLPENATPEAKVRAMNSFIFEEMHYRFPPHSQYAKDVDVYSFLPSVLDSRRGVCLGVSILYLCLSQRLDVPLEMITPPGHIYVRYRDGDDIINIETTARGVDMDSKVYLGVNTRALQQRNIKEVIGMAHFNQASTYLQNDAFDKALAAYKRALPYQPDDLFLKELIGYSKVLSGEKEEGVALLEEIKDHLPDYAVAKNSMAEDYLNGFTDENGIRTIFLSVDETRESLQKKRRQLEETLEKYPKFRTARFALATTWLQLHRMSEGLNQLETYHKLDPTDPTAEYYLSVLYMERMDYSQARKHLNHAIALAKKRDHSPKVLIDLDRQLEELAPERTEAKLKKERP